MTKEERNQFVKQIEEQVAIAKNALQKIAEIADGRDGNVCFLAKYRRGDLDTIVECANIEKN